MNKAKISQKSNNPWKFEHRDDVYFDLAKSPGSSIFSHFPRLLCCPISSEKPEFILKTDDKRKTYANFPKDGIWIIILHYGPVFELPLWSLDKNSNNALPILISELSKSKFRYRISMKVISSYLWNIANSLERYSSLLILVAYQNFRLNATLLLCHLWKTLASIQKSDKG